MKPRAFIPGRKFPDISITGSSCALMCDYCRGHYLNVMEHVLSPRELYTTVKHLVKKGARGVLISGGFNIHGYLPIEPYLPVIRDVKRDFGIIVSVHAGIVDRELADKLREAGVDIIDYEIQLDPLVIRNIKHLNREPIDFVKSYEILLKHGPPYIAPHIPIGFNYGKIGYEWSAINILREFRPYIIIFLVFMPTRNTPMEDIQPPKVSEVVKLISYAREIFGSNTILALGCMRPWHMKFTLDKIVVEQQLVDRIVNTPIKIIKDYKLDVVEACCSVPEELLDLFY